MSQTTAPGLEDLELEARSIFGTPVAAQVLPDAAALNRDLKPAVLEQAAAVSSPPGEGWCGPYGPADWGANGGATGAGDALAKVIAAAAALADVLDGADAAATLDPAARTIRVAAQRLTAGQGIPIGSSPTARWCARYVIDDGRGDGGERGGSGAPPDLGGRFEAQDPRGVAPVMYAPHLSIAGAAGPTLGVTQSVGLPSGALLIYPGWLLHGVEPYRGETALLALSIQMSA